MRRLHCKLKLLLIHNEGNWPNGAYSSFQCWFPRKFSGSAHSSSLMGGSLDLRLLSTRKFTPNNVKSRENTLEGMSSPLIAKSFNVQHSLLLRKLPVRTMLPGSWTEATTSLTLNLSESDLKPFSTRYFRDKGVFPQVTWASSEARAIAQRCHN